jgi:hypothetical protein
MEVAAVVVGVGIVRIEAYRLAVTSDGKVNVAFLNGRICSAESCFSMIPV